MTSPQFLSALLEQLQTLYITTERDVRVNTTGSQGGAGDVDSKRGIEGMWLNLSRPNCQECIAKIHLVNM